MEKFFVRIVYLIVGMGVMFNMGHSVWMNLRAWAGEPRREEFKVMPQDRPSDTGLSPLPETEYGPALPPRTEIEEKVFSNAETKYLSKSRYVVESTSVLGQRLVKSAPKWWDKYHPILKAADKLSARLKKPYSQMERRDFLADLDAIDGQFIATNEKVSDDIRRFFGSLEVAKILAGKPPQTMSEDGKESLKKLGEDLKAVELQTRESLWKHHILENPNDKKNGWSCRIVIRTLLADIRTLLATTTARQE